MRHYLWPLVPLAFLAASCTTPNDHLNATQEDPVGNFGNLAFPDNPAGRQFSAWLAAFNAADREALQMFVESFSAAPAPNVEGMLSLRQRSGGFNPIRVEEFSETSISVLLQERASEQFVRASIEVDNTSAHRILAAPLRAIPTPSEYATQRLSDADLRAELSAFLESSDASQTFSGSVLVMKDGQEVFAGAYGAADLDQGLDNALDSRFRISSMGKMFTATAVMQLVQAGEVSLSAPIATYLPDYPNQEVGSGVTIEHLLTHTGGTGDIFTPEFFEQAANIDKLQDYVSMFGSRGLRFEPGVQFEYSNYGYILLGRIIEAASGLDYYDYLQQHIFEPSGMHSTGFWPESEPLTGRVISYDSGPEGLMPIPGTPTDRASPAGGAISTVRDMYRFSQALMSNDLLDEHHTNQMFTGRVERGPAFKYAFGFGDSARGTPEHHVGHNGGAPGQNGDMRIYLEAGYVVIVLSNFSPPSAQRVSDFVADRLQI